jgi:hypothetical protein
VVVELKDILVVLNHLLQDKVQEDLEVVQVMDQEDQETHLLLIQHKELMVELVLVIQILVVVEEEQL